MTYRIGILGSDNSHALTFSRILHGLDESDRVDGLRVTDLFGLDALRNREVAEKGKIARIVSDPGEMMGSVDAVFVEFRHGGLHLQYAKPFLENGIPVFVDKPLASNTADARELIRLASENNVLLASFSTLRFTKVVQEAAQYLRAEEPVFVSVCGPGDPDSEYGGLSFYGIHAADIFNEISGCGSNQVMASRRGKDVVTTVVHEKLTGNIKVSANIPYIFTVEVFTRESYLAKQVDTQGCYRHGLLKIKAMLDAKCAPMTKEAMFEPVALIEAMERSITDGGRTSVARLESCTTMP